MCAKKNKPPRGLTITLAELNERWSDFQKRFPTDEDCIEEILTLGNFDARVCLKCGNEAKNRDAGSPFAKCTHCSTEVYLFKGTFFERLRKPKAYLAALWLRSEQIGISSNRLARLVHIAQSTAYEIQRKIDKVIFEVMMEDALTAYSGQFRPIMTKRSSETPARENAAAEQDLVDLEQRANANSQSSMNDGDDADISSSTATGASCEQTYSAEQSQPGPDAKKSGADAENSVENSVPENSRPDQERLASSLDAQFEFQELLLNSLSDTEPIHVDDLVESLNAPVSAILSALLMMQLDSKVVDLGGMRFKKSKRERDLLGLAKFFRIDEKALERFFSQVHHVFHGVSRKNLQLYLAWFWSLVGVIFKDPANLIFACAKFRHLSRHDIREFVTEPTVKVLFQ